MQSVNASSMTHEARMTPPYLKDPTADPFEFDIAPWKFFHLAGNFKKENGYSWNNPDHMMVFTM